MRLPFSFMIMNHEPLFSKTVGGQHVMSFAVSVRVCLIMNHGTIFHKL